MSSETIEVKNRQEVGTAACRRLRASGYIPANLYGHGEQNQNLSVREDSLRSIIQHGTKVLSLTGDISDTALLREVQWDAFGIDVIHVDLTRVSSSETVEVTLPIELHGEAPGVFEGGQLAVPMHVLTIRCLAASVPEHLTVNLSNLHLGGAIHANEVPLPEGAELVTPGAEVVVHLVKPAGLEAVEDSSGAEPELIRKEKPAGDE